MSNRNYQPTPGSELSQAGLGMCTLHLEEINNGFLFRIDYRGKRWFAGAIATNPINVRILWKRLRDLRQAGQMLPLDFEPPNTLPWVFVTKVGTVEEVTEEQERFMKGFATRTAFALLRQTRPSNHSCN